jgi:hypothetical protein
VGFQSKQVEMRIPSSDKPGVVFVSLDVSAEKQATASAGDSASDSTELDERLRGFRERARTNRFAHFVDEPTIGKLHIAFISDALRKVPGISVKPSQHVGNIVRMRNCGANSSSELSAPLVWLDGVRLPGAELDEVTQASDVAGVEVYSSFAGIPAEYFDRTAKCGTILVWTKG